MFDVRKYDDGWWVITGLPTRQVLGPYGTRKLCEAAKRDHIRGGNMLNPTTADRMADRFRRRFPA